MAPRRQRRRQSHPGLDQATRFSTCHSFGHEWHHEEPLGQDEIDGWTPPLGMGGMIGFPSVCQMCGSERMRWCGRSGENQNRYHYPDGYQRSAKRGEEVLTPTEWRRDYVQGIFDRFEADVLAERRQA